ncbi:HoxN/HupN/NixA family nickel/cobalt transporter [Acidianus sulfidivorans JP7]|uniref:Nickel/cobalt efflux system n=1 Tax=Acidianus sulfidivorans JP7 TaxID=619593 RepID=A0A2U9IJM6_9CREN|nr:HoxN/HupN/NixA family nickel/cobalt transporter [Acidianus sulfidivorans]AWR96220.1 HoxN/HupN/NixA family nickel/cobalt transporter [Acidianus sulfidivorans JP7]
MAKISLTRKSILVAFYAINIILTIIFFSNILFLFPKSDYKIQTDTGTIVGTFLTLGILGYTFGLRHAVDADHLAAIDNVTRKLLQEGKEPVLVGTFFSLGHSTVVILLSLMLILATKFVVSNLTNFENIGNIIGTVISGGFLYIIAILNTVVLAELYRTYKKVRNEKNFDEKNLNEVLMKRGFMNRFFGKLFKIVTSDWQMYVIGFLFGLGFDTATEVAILAISASIAGAFSSIPITTILILPGLFALGMSLIDTSDGVFMRSAYAWAFKNSLGKLWYNLTMTFISIMIAFGIGTIELIGVIQSEFNLSGLFWDQIAALNNDYWEFIGYFIIMTFGVTWIVSSLIYKYRVSKIRRIS